MHELAICQSLIDAVAAIAADHDAGRVSDIHVSIGPLSGVEPALLVNAFPVAAAGTAAEPATLHVHDQPVRVRCESCGAESEATANHLVCGECDNWRTSIISGDGLLLQRVCMTKNSEGTEIHV